MKSLRAAYRKIFMSTETVSLSFEERLTELVRVINENSLHCLLPCGSSA